MIDYYSAQYSIFLIAAFILAFTPGPQTREPSIDGTDQL